MRPSTLEGMNTQTKGWALLEVVIAMALMSAAISAVVSLQSQSLMLTHRALADAQALGLANEAWTSVVLGWQAHQIHANQTPRLAAISTKPTIEISQGPVGPVVHISQDSSAGDRATIRWQLPVER